MKEGAFLNAVFFGHFADKLFTITFSRDTLKKNVGGEGCG